MILSQENRLYNDHRFTCERWGGDFDAFFAFFCADKLSAWNKKPLGTVSQVASFIFVNEMLTYGVPETRFTSRTNYSGSLQGQSLMFEAPLLVALTPSPAKDFSASQMGNFGADANLNSATIVAPNPMVGAGVELQAAVAKSFAGLGMLLGSASA
ncbi:hypothetical protein [Pelosinus baikalensis]|uniref:Uncharacterized protein n=1 Tax=Pelosinus baikalensis TaxID=2892015 RepID=A0ABS8HRV0_9FIRM|nr:hypothetical protein [Pelosinus baikalensis]MCC5465918.1 hypothetical protein [Pelosinus baikalensis]